jgi:hypothetical protein
VNLALQEDPAATMAADTSCSIENYLALPDHTMDARIAEARAALGSTAVVLGHHYQRDEVVRFADFTGDSYKLSKIAAETGARYIVFCGVHFMAESADVLGRDGQQVILPDLNAGCSMADMAEISQVEHCWEVLERMGLAEQTVPITYMNSTAAIKAFCGERGGLPLGLRARTKDPVSARSAPGPQHGLRHGNRARRDGGMGSVGPRGRPDPGQTFRDPGAPVEGPLLGASAFSARPC